MKRSILIFFFFVFVMAGSLSACAPQPTQVVTPSSTKTTVIVSTPIPTAAKPTPQSTQPAVDLSNLAGLQIHFMHPWVGQTQTELVKMVDQFNQTNEWGIHVIMEAPGSAAMVTSKVWEGIANNAPPNIVVAATSFLMAIDEKEQLVVDLVPYVSSTQFGLTTTEIEDFTPIFWNEDLIGDKRLGIPAQRSALLMAYNTTWANELGFKNPPQTPDEFMAQVCAANASFRKDADETNDGLGGWIINLDPLTVYSWLTAFGAHPDNNGEYKFSGNAGDAAFTYLFDLKKEACAWLSKSGQEEEHFSKREALVYTVWLQDLRMLNETLQRNGSSDEWAVIPFPSIGEQTVTTNGSSYAILHQNTEEDLAAWLFIRWLSQPGQQESLLQTLVTLPLSRSAEKLVGNVVELPQWTQGSHYTDLFTSQPADADWQVVNPILADAGWQLLRTEIKADQIPALLVQMDDLVKELGGRYP